MPTEDLNHLENKEESQSSSANLIDKYSLYLKNDIPEAQKDNVNKILSTMESTFSGKTELILTGLLHSGIDLSSANLDYITNAIKESIDDYGASIGNVDAGTIIDYLLVSINSKALDAEIEAKQKEVEAKQKEVEAKQKEVEAKQKEVEAKQKEVEAKQKEVEAKQKEVEAKQKEVEAKQEEVEVTQEIVQEKNVLQQSEVVSKDSEVKRTRTNAQIFSDLKDQLLAERPELKQEFETFMKERMQDLSDQLNADPEKLANLQSLAQQEGITDIEQAKQTYLNLEFVHVNKDQFSNLSAEQLQRIDTEYSKRRDVIEGVDKNRGPQMRQSRPELGAENSLSNTSHFEENITLLSNENKSVKSYISENTIPMPEGVQKQLGNIISPALLNAMSPQDGKKIQEMLPTMIQSISSTETTSASFGGLLNTLSATLGPLGNDFNIDQKNLQLQENGTLSLVGTFKNTPTSCTVLPDGTLSMSDTITNSMLSLGKIPSMQNFQNIGSELIQSTLKSTKDKLKYEGKDPAEFIKLFQKIFTEQFTKNIKENVKEQVSDWDKQIDINKIAIKRQALKQDSWQTFGNFFPERKGDQLLDLSYKERLSTNKLGDDVQKIDNPHRLYTDVLENTTSRLSSQDITRVRQAMETIQNKARTIDLKDARYPELLSVFKKNNQPNPKEFTQFLKLVTNKDPLNNEFFINPIKILKIAEGIGDLQSKPEKPELQTITNAIRGVKKDTEAQSADIDLDRQLAEM